MNSVLQTESGLLQQWSHQCSAMEEDQAKNAALPPSVLFTDVYLSTYFCTSWILSIVKNAKDTDKMFDSLVAVGRNKVEV